MIDGCGRKIDYIRISVTDRCNLRCQYCMPEDGVEMVSHGDILTFNEIVRSVNILAGLGIAKVKITGGEPLVRKNIAALISDIKEIDGISSVTLTTNGVLLSEQIGDLYSAGIDAINVSLDTLNPEVFRFITRRDDLGKVLRGIDAALAYPDISLKINCVPFGIENQNLWELTDFARDNNIHVRYIEMMPIGFGKEYKCLTESEIIALLESKTGEELIPYDGILGNGPCHYYSVNGFAGKIGFISAISHKFCDSCNRVRLTATGFLKNCLQYEYGSELRKYLRDGTDDENLSKIIEATIMNKPVGHQFLSGEIANENGHMMSQIGG